MPVQPAADAIDVLTFLLNRDIVSLKDTEEGFCTRFPRDIHFQTLCHLSAHLQEEHSVLGLEERIAALYLFRALYTDTPVERNPFRAFLIKVAEDAHKKAEERCFVLLLLGDACGHLSHQTPRQIAASLPARLPPSFLADLQDASRKQSLPSRHEEQEQQQEQEVDAATHSSSSTSTTQQEAPVLSRVLLSHGIQLPFQRPTPPSLPIQHGELSWLHPPPAIPLWQQQLSGAGEAAEQEAEAQAQPLAGLMAAALAGPLLPAQQQQLLSQLVEHPVKLQRCGLRPEDLPLLVDKNPSVAFEVLVRLLRAEEGAPPAHLAALAGLPLSLHALEVVNRLTLARALPGGCVSAFVSGCIAACERAEDKAVQGRLVRLVCVFLQSLIKNGLINLQELFLEVQAFCISFSRIREAAGLFRLLKTIEAAGDDEGGDQGGALPPHSNGTSE